MQPRSVRTMTSSRLEQQEIYNKAREEAHKDAQRQLQAAAEQMAEQAAQWQRQQSQLQASEVNDLIKRFEKEHIRAPQHRVQCGDERQAVIECLAAKKGGSALECAHIAAVFDACAAKVSQGLMKRGDA